MSVCVWPINYSYSVDIKNQNKHCSRRTKLRSGVKVEVAILGYPSRISLMVSVAVKQH